MAGYKAEAHEQHGGNFELVTVGAIFSIFCKSGSRVEILPIVLSNIHMDFENWKVVDLRNKLKELGLPTSGLKQQLIERLQAAFDEKSDTENVPESPDFEVVTATPSRTPARESIARSEDHFPVSPRLELEEVSVEEKLVQSQRETER